MTSRPFSSFDLQHLSSHEKYQLLASTIVPRPIALVTSRGQDGSANAAPFSFFNVLSPDPPILALGIEDRSDGRTKDTKRNLRNAGEFVVNLVSEEMAAAMNRCAADFPPEVNELDESGFETLEADVVDAPRILAAPVSFECRLYMELRLGQDGCNSVLLAEVTRVHLIDDALSNDRNIDPHCLNLIGRLAGGDYVRLSDRFRMPRL